MSALRGFVDVRPDERRNTFAAFGTLLAITTGHTLLETARDAEFLSKLPATQLPWMYLLIVVLALVISQFRNTDSKHAIAVWLIGAAGITAFFWWLMRHLTGRTWILYGLYVWSGLFGSWVTVQFWTLLGRVHTMTQAKRLYGFIGAGAVLGAVCGAGFGRALLTIFAPRTLLLGAAVLFLVAVAPVMAVRAPQQTTEPVAERWDNARATEMTTGGKLLWQNAFARSILGIGFLATISVTLGDFLFKSKIAAEMHDTRSLATALATFYVITNAFSLVAQLFVGPWIFRTVGVQRTLFLFPVLFLGAASGVLVTFGRLASAVLLKVVDGTFRYSVHRTSMELLLVPIPDGTRERIKPIIDLVGNRGGQAAASVVLLALVAVEGNSVLAVGACIVILTVAWLALVFRIRGHYLDVFRETLRSGGLSGKAELPELDLGALEMLFTGLNSSRDGEVLASLELLAEQHRERLIPALILYHPSREVVLRALEIFTQRGRADFVSIADRLNAHPDREVASAALRARSAVAPDRKLLESRLEDSCAQVAATALIAMMARGWIELDEGERRVREAFAKRSWQTAAEIARAIRDIGSHLDPEMDPRRTQKTLAVFDEILVRLAREAKLFRATHDDEDPRPDESPDVPGQLKIAPEIRVRLEVAKAMAERQNPAFLPLLVGMLNRHELRSTARAAIRQIPGALDFLDEIMSHHDFARDVRIHLPRTMVVFEPALAARKLMAHLVDERDGAVRFKIMRALVRLRHNDRDLVLDGDALRTAADSILEHAEALRRWELALAQSTDGASPSGSDGDPLRAAHRLLVDLVHDKESHAIQRLFMLFELMYKEDFDDIQRGLRGKNPKTRANSLELIENIVRPPLRNRILDLVGERRATVPDPIGYDDAILEILAEGGTTMRTLAEYRAVELGLDTSVVVGARASHPPTMESIGRKLADRARGLVTRDTMPPMPPPGATRAPA